MMRCDQVRPLLYRAAEGETNPEEAMRVARHLPACTACRILFARENRLAEMLERGLQDIPVDDGLVADVMSRLPEVPRRRIRKRRGLKLAGLLLGMASGAALALGQAPIKVAATGLTGPRWDAEATELAGRGLVVLVQLAVTAVERLGSSALLTAPHIAIDPAAVTLVGPAMACALAAATTLFWLLARSLARPSRQSD